MGTNNNNKRIKRNYPIDIDRLGVKFFGEKQKVFDVDELVDDETFIIIQALPETIRHLLVHGLKQKLCDGHASLKAEVNTDNEGKPLPKSEWRSLTDEEIVGSMTSIFESLKKGWGVRVTSAKTQTVRMLENAGVTITAGMTPQELATAMIEAAEKLQQKTDDN